MPTTSDQFSIVVVGEAVAVVDIKEAAVAVVSKQIVPLNTSRIVVDMQAGTAAAVDVEEAVVSLAEIVIDSHSFSRTF